MEAKTYGLTDTQRFVSQVQSSPRGDFARDRGRLLHSSALRRLAAKTQVLSPSAGLDFARNRLTHSLEVAQIGRELASRLGLNADVVETACLAHDIGHPPFGHNGERALSDWALECGGFEGNAQTFRLLVRLEPKVHDDHGVSRGLNLTRASLLASMKYPWGSDTAVMDPSGREKFGVYEEDTEVFDWARDGLADRILTPEAQVMDFSDDVAYSVHDFEDAIVNGYLDASSLGSATTRADVVGAMAPWVGNISPDRLDAAWERLQNVLLSVSDYQGTRADLARLKNLTSTLIGRFAVTSEITAEGNVSSLRVPESTRDEISVLKGIVAIHVMSHTTRQPLYLHQRDVVKGLADALKAEPAHLDAVFAEDFQRAHDTIAQHRVIVDQVASMTDQSAMALYQRLGFA